MIHAIHYLLTLLVQDLFSLKPEYSLTYKKDSVLPCLMPMLRIEILTQVIHIYTYPLDIGPSIVPF